MFVADPAILERSGFFYFFIKKTPLPRWMPVRCVCVCACGKLKAKGRGGGDHCTAMVPPFRCFFAGAGSIYRPLTHTPGSFRS